MERHTDIQGTVYYSKLSDGKRIFSLSPDFKYTWDRDAQVEMERDRTNTAQQEMVFEIYAKNDDLNPLVFDEFYPIYCIEHGLFNDK